MPALTTHRPLDRDQVQGIIVRGYDVLPHAAYVLLRVVHPAAARRWAGAVPVTPAAEKPQGATGHAVHVAFTAPGLQALGLGDEALSTFSREFQEGIATPHRQRMLGDEGDLAPDRWEWGGPGNVPHVLLMLFAGSDAALEALYAREEARWAGALKEQRRLGTITLPDQKEHFGFHDGIAQPLLSGLGAPGDPVDGNVLPTGEFVLGYENAYDRMPDSPVVPAAADPHGVLPAGQEPGHHDLGANGSYMVFRQLEQDVQGFWRFLDARARRPAPAGTVVGPPPEQPEKRRIWLGAKIVGRWPNGAPLVQSPEAEPPSFDPETGDAFLYHPDDAHGDLCPVASHIRRANPRDSMLPGPDESLVVSARHRLLRRGRSYGRPVAESFRPDDILAAPPDAEARGLHFISFNADLARQFEFVQQTWLNSPKFDGLYQDPDPLVGPHPDPHDPATRPEEVSNFTIPACPVRHREAALPRFVHVRGGAYFFMPSVAALRYLAHLPEPRAGGETC